jgi:hypothetical protein
MAADRDRRQDAPWDEAFFQAELKATTRIKHMVLGADIEKFAYHMPALLYYVDGFAGAGVYAAGGTDQVGSPVLIARVGQRMQASKPGFHLRCINVEKTPSTYAQLERVTAPFRPDIVEINFHGPFIDFIPDILERIKEAPTSSSSTHSAPRTSRGHRSARSSRGRSRPRSSSISRRRALRKKPATSPGSNRRTRSATTSG